MRQHTDQAVAHIRTQLAEIPHIAIILGSGLGEYAASFSEPTIIPYTDIPHFPRSTVTGHKGRLVFQQFDGFSVIAMQGRFHYYEGYTLEQVTFPVRVLGLLGVSRLLVTNASGGLNPDFQPGDLMLIRDHLNLMGDNPLRGQHEERFGPRFPDMTEAYNQADAQVFESAAQALGITLRQGVYAGLSGPSYETPAEIKMLRVLGADAVGMSTVPEVIVANQMGMRVSGVSCITNLAAGIHPHKLSHQEVIETTQRVKTRFIRLLERVVREFGHHHS